jgi:MarR family transcriptional regulator, organic hydroperoxide resistance regulator
MTSSPVSVTAVQSDFGRLMRSLHFGRGGRQVPWAGVQLTLPQLKLLGLLACRPGGLHGRELAGILGVGPPAVTALVERLVEHGYARREEDPRDRRITWVRLTDDGRTVLERATAGQRERLGELLTSLDEVELATVARAIRLLCEASERLPETDCAPADHA